MAISQPTYPIETQDLVDYIGGYADGQIAAAVIGAGGEQGIVATAVKASAYTAAPGDEVLVDISAADVPVTLPAAPPDKTRVALKVVNVPSTPGAHSATLNAGGTDRFNKPGGSATLTFSALFQGAIAKYATSTGIWTVTATDAALGNPLGAAKLGSDGTVGGTGGSPLAPKIVIALGTAGAPTSGTWSTGQAVIDANGISWSCTAGGTPGTWVEGPTGGSTSGGLPLSGGTMSGAIAMGSNKITGLANGSNAQDAAAFGQIPVADATASDFQPDAAAAAAGSTGKWADAGHVHPASGFPKAGGLTGATAATRYVGATASGAPASGAFLTGDFVIDQTGRVWICTASGSPGTWVSPSASVPSIVATTGVTGYTLVNGTGTILTWTAPNDGNLHVMRVVGEVIVGSAETGGAIVFTATNPNGGPNITATVQSGGHSTGTAAFTNNDLTVGPGAVCTLTQNTALTAGSGICFAALYSL